MSLPKPEIRFKKPRLMKRKNGEFSPWNNGKRKSRYPARLTRNSFSHGLKGSMLAPQSVFWKRITNSRLPQMKCWICLATTWKIYTTNMRGSIPRICWIVLYAHILVPLINFITLQISQILIIMMFLSCFREKVNVRPADSMGGKLRNSRHYPHVVGLGLLLSCDLLKHMGFGLRF